METAISSIFTPGQVASISHAPIPRHIAVIPDGNRRWAKAQNASCLKGHEAGANNLIEIIKAAKDLGVKVVTFYLFSTENWSRPQEEINALMWLLERFLKDKCPEMIANETRLKTIGNTGTLPANVQKTIEETIQATSHCRMIDLVLAINYGGRDDLTRAFKRIHEDCINGKLRKEEVTEKLIAGYLDTNSWGDPELLIRTSGEMRISNFLLWQLSYAEIYITNLLWPEFSPNDLLDAIKEFQKRERRLGGT